MKRRILAAATLAAVVGLAAAPAEAAVSAVGWWTRNPTASAPEGGMQVANGLDGVISYGAVRAVEVGDDIEAAVLTLQESGQGVNAAGGSLQACPAAGTWTAGQGDLVDGPKADCKAATVALTRNADGQWTGDVTKVLTGTTPALAVVPGEGAGVFQVSFAAPTLDVKTRQGAGSGSTTSDFDASEFTAPATTTPSSDSSGSSGSSGSGSSNFEPSSTGSLSSSSGTSRSTGSFAPTFESATPPQEVAAAIDAGATVEGDAGDASSASTFVARPAAAPPLEVSGNRWAQFGLFLVTAAIIGTFAGIGRNRLMTKSA